MHALFLEHLKELIQEIILELRRLLVSGDGIRHISQIGIAQDRSHLVGQLHQLPERKALVRGRHVNPAHQLRLHHAQQIVDPMGVPRIGKPLSRRFIQGDPQLLLHKFRAGILPCLLKNLLA